MLKLHIASLPGYAPTIGQLVDMMAYSRAVLLLEVDGLSQADLDHLHDSDSNTIGALLTHCAAVERAYQFITFEEREWTEEEGEAWHAALTLGDLARAEIKGRALDSYVAELAETRARTLEALAQRDDEWLRRPLALNPQMNAHWAWFHVMEDEINHRGQIRWLRVRLPSQHAG